MKIESKILSSLEKVFSAETPSATEVSEALCLQGERFHFQIAYRLEDESINSLVTPIRLTSDLEDSIKLYQVKEVPVRVPWWNGNDDYFLKKTPGMYPDLLIPCENGIKLLNHQWRSLWVEVAVPENAAPGCHNISIQLLGENDTPLSDSSFSLNIINAKLPEQELICTHWFHGDCLSTYYGVEPLSEEHWKLIGNFMENYSTYGSNMILTPVFTPALDTAVGAERPTVQLVDVTEKDGNYSFGFDKLDRYIALAQEKGIRYFEIAHLFTQWGAKFTPKIVADDGRKLFGWHVSATSQEYRGFLGAFLPTLKDHLRSLGILDRCWFHISDEPSEEHLDSYRAALDVAREYLSDCNMIDALSEYKFYEQGLVKTPIPANNAIDEFLEHQVTPLWTYYCCSQGRSNVSNRFMSMPSARNRILGLQLFKYQIQGFLHWGFNFWYSQYSVKPINPFCDTDADEGFPSGDAFLVYPGEHGQPLPSIREMVFGEAIQDLRALKLLEQHLGHEETVAWLENLSGQKITFSEYPHGSEYLLHIRNEVNRKLQELYP